jgi:CheY-like chemotaxis protein
MEIVARLAGGVAHDFNNLLSVILLHSDMLLTVFGHEETVRRHAIEIKMATGRAAVLTHQLLALGGRQLMHPTVLSLNEELKRYQSLLEKILGRKIELNMKLGMDVDHIDADPIHLEQVVLSMVANARDAMSDGGQLTISTRLFQNEANNDQLGLPSGSYARISISDTGSGMDAGTLTHIFEPFFTTKSGKGAGLGLSTAYGIVKQFGGRIMVDTEPGSGTIIDIYLPHLVDTSSAQRAASAENEATGGAEIILLVDDEEMVRRAASEILQLYGYQVIEAASGSEALEICEECDDPISLLLTDVSMPEMSGPELAEAIGIRWPAMRVLYMSGFTDAADGNQRLLREGVAFIEKPFEPDALARRIRDIIKPDRPAQT